LLSLVGYSMECIHLLNDNAPVHKSVVVKEYPVTHGINTLLYPP